MASVESPTTEKSPENCVKTGSSLQEHGQSFPITLLHPAPPGIPQSNEQVKLIIHPPWFPWGSKSALGVLGDFGSPPLWFTSLVLPVLTPCMAKQKRSQCRINSQHSAPSSLTLPLRSDSWIAGIRRCLGDAEGC